MHCPACDAEMEELLIDGISFDLCSRGCGGIWFDRFELKRVDEAHEATGDKLLAVPVQASRVPDPNRRRQCPRCSSITLHRHFFDVSRSVEVDSCPGCAGVWLDADELNRIRSSYRSEQERDQAADAYFSQVLQRQMGTNTD